MMEKQNVVYPHNETLFGINRNKYCYVPDTQKNTYGMFSFIRKIQKRQVRRDRKQISGCQGLGKGGWGVSDNRHVGFPFWGDENVLEQNSNDSHTTLSAY